MTHEDTEIKRQHQRAYLKKWRKDNPEKFNAQVERAKPRQAEYRAAHKEKAIERSREWRKANPGYVKAQNSKYRKLHPERHRKYMQKYREGNKDKVNAKSAKFREANPNYLRTHYARRSNPGASEELLKVIVLKNMIREEIRNQTKPQ